MRNSGVATDSQGKKMRRFNRPQKLPRESRERSALDIAGDLIGKGRRDKPDYREASLRIHGMICAKCGRDFEASNRHLLTVHHKDGNHRNNPPDGSNWENLCIDCHDDEHNRGQLADYLNKD